MKGDERILRKVDRTLRLNGTWPTPLCDYCFWCPGCKCGHAVYLTEKNERNAQWTWDGNLEQPTFSPSFLHDLHKPRCHCIITKGIIHFCADCEHELAGQIVPMVAF